MLDPELFERVIGESARHLCHLTFYFQGEPYLHPSFLKLVRLAKRQRIYTVTSTNSHYLDDQRARETVDSGLDRLIISVDGATQETYEQYRIGGTLEKVLNGARKVVEWKKKLKRKHPYVVFQMLVVRPNEHQLEDVRKLAVETGVDEVVFKTAQVYDYENGNSLIPLNNRYSRYVQQFNGTWKVKNKLENHCWKMWNSCVMTWDGKIVPCCFDKDAQHVVGNVVDASLQAVWNSVPYRNFRAQLFNGRKEIDICSNCSEGTKVFS